MCSACSKTCRSIAAKLGASRLSRWPAIWHAEDGHPAQKSRPKPEIRVQPADPRSGASSIGDGDHAGEAYKLLGILRLVVDTNLVMHMRPGTAAGTAKEADLVVFGDGLPDRHSEAVKMRVKGGDAVAVVDLDYPAVIAVIPSVSHDPGGRRIDRRHVRPR